VRQELIVPHGFGVLHVTATQPQEKDPTTEYALLGSTFAGALNR
jgi:hypothetical protein